MKMLRVALFGLVGLAVGASVDDYTNTPPKNVKTRGAAYDNDASGKYICSGLSIQHCALDGSACYNVEYCADGCFDTGHGALCADRGLQSRGELDIASVTGTRSKCDGVSGKCRECTDTRRGVYTCSSGFCAVKPGDWCKAGWSCQDDCDCCKKDRKRGVQVLERSTDDIEINPSTANVLKPTQRCEPGTTKCTDDRNTVCKCADIGDWYLYRWCKVPGSCQGSDTPGLGDHWCEGGPDLVSRDVSESLRVPTLLPKECTPATYACARGGGAILVCNPEGYWKVAARCCELFSCDDSSGVPHCIDNCSPKPRSLETGDDKTHSNAIPATLDTKGDARHIGNTLELQVPASDCIPGSYDCTHPFSDGILICGPDGRWQVSSLCCGVDTCDATGVPHCKCSPEPHALDAVEEAPRINNALEQRSDLGMGCTPATYGCTGRRDAIIVCDLNGQWQLAALCSGAGDCNIVPSQPNVPYCTYFNGPSTPHMAVNSTHAKPVVAELDYEESCEPATYQCTRRYADALQVCGLDRKWKLAATCCGVHTCRISPFLEVPQCHCTNESRSLDASAPEEETPGTQQEESEETPAACSPGTFQCRQPFVYGQLQVCNSLGVWDVSSNCCGPYTCIIAQGDVPAHCECSPKPQTFETVGAPSTMSVAVSTKV